MDGNDGHIGPSGIMHMPTDDRVPRESTVAAFTTSSSSTSSWFGLDCGLVGVGRKRKRRKSGAMTEVLESTDAPTQPTFEFN